MSVRWDVSQADIDEVFGNDIDDLLYHSSGAWEVVQGLRSIIEQKALYDAYLAAIAAGKPGNLAAPPGRSAHNWGLAVDVAILTPSGPSWDYSAPQWAPLYAAVDAHPRLHGGWNFGDDDHIESTAWIAKRVQLKQSGKW